MKNTTPWAVRALSRLLVMVMAAWIGFGPAATSYAQAVDPVARGLAAKANTTAGVAAAGGRIGVPVYNNSNVLLRKWNRGLAGVRENSRDAVAEFIGDSTTAGFGADAGADSRALSLPTKLATILTNQYGISASAASFWGNGGLGTASQYQPYDPRITSTGAEPYNVEGPGGLAWFLDQSGDTLAFTPGGTFDTIDVFWHDNSTSGRSVTIDTGGATIATITTTGGTGLKKTTVSLGGTVSTVYVKWAAGGGFYLRSVVPRTAATHQVIIYNQGRGGWTSTSWAALTSQFAVQSADLFVINLMINDWRTGVPVATSETNMRAIITAAKAVGDVIIVGPTPTNPSSISAATQAPYQELAKRLAFEYNVPFVSFAEDFGSYSLANSLGYMADDYHPRSLGYERQAQLLAQVMMRP